jgi:DNA-directed RNA polymerase subunit RPC12/RpoP
MVHRMIPFVGGYVAGARAKTRAAAMGMSAHAFEIDLRTMGEHDERTERLTLVVEAMWEILKREGYTDADLENEINAVMARRDEGAAAAKGQPCPECGARIAGGKDMCQYCGHHVAAEPNPLAGL